MTIENPSDAMLAYQNWLSQPRSSPGPSPAANARWESLMSWANQTGINITPGHAETEAAPGVTMRGIMSMTPRSINGIGSLPPMVSKVLQDCLGALQAHTWQYMTAASAGHPSASQLLDLVRAETAALGVVNENGVATVPANSRLINWAANVNYANQSMHYAGCVLPPLGHVAGASTPRHANFIGGAD